MHFTIVGLFRSSCAGVGEMAAEIQQTRLGVAVDMDMLHRHIKHRVAAHIVRLQHAAMQMRQGIGHLRLAAGAVGPNMLLEALLRGELGDAGKVLGTSCCCADSTFTHKWPLARKIGWMAALRLMHSTSVGGSSVTLVTAVMVMP